MGNDAENFEEDEDEFDIFAEQKPRPSRGAMIGAPPMAGGQNAAQQVHPLSGSHPMAPGGAGHEAGMGGAGDLNQSQALDQSLANMAASTIMQPSNMARHQYSLPDGPNPQSIVGSLNNTFSSQSGPLQDSVYAG